LSKVIFGIDFENGFRPDRKRQASDGYCRVWNSEERYPEASAAGARIMQRNSDKRCRDPRSIDMAAIIALLALVIAASAVLSEASKESRSPTAIDTTVRW
jgi:hypothetical protein